MPRSVDIFCRVVDNYGDIGVTWRLARQLVDEYGFDVRLFVDDLASLEKISSKHQYLRASPSIIHWKSPPANDFDNSESRNIFKPVRPEPVERLVNQSLAITPFDKLRANSESLDFSNTFQPADIVIEAFACDLPAAYLDKMAARETKPVWLNLEYLSAEPWVAEHHLLPSPHPRLGLTKYFFFPGFSDQTGGLIREKSIAHTRQVSVPAPQKIFAFGYDTAHSRALLSAMANADAVSRLTLAEGAMADAAQHLPKCQQQPFVPQPDFDAVLAAHDFLWVRGEDSFVRAQYAGKPFIWQIYPQEAGAHLVKLNAFLDLYCAGMSPECAAAVRALNVWLSDDSTSPANPPWQNALNHWPEWQRHAHHWQKTRLAQTDLATRLVSFCRKSLII